LTDGQVPSLKFRGKEFLKPFFPQALIFVREWSRYRESVLGHLTLFMWLAEAAEDDKV